MATLDWLVLAATLLAIVGYGYWQTRGVKSMEGYLLGNKSLPWWTVGLSIMATQASAVTFLSTPGQAFEDGMRFLQFYFGLPLAMVILCVTAVPLFNRLKVYTAYEYLETRFDLKVRVLGAILFLFLRGLSVGITIFAPSLILSTLLGWEIIWTTALIGTLVMMYAVSGGTRAVSLTQKYQLTIIMVGMLIAGGVAFAGLPAEMTFSDTFRMAGEMGKMNLINTEFNLADRYNIWSGLIGGLFLFLAYFGTDQSQVGRYIGARDTTESRLGLIFNGLLKIPMQFIILYIGILVFLFYQFSAPPVFHNRALYEKAKATPAVAALDSLERSYQGVFERKRQAAGELAAAVQTGGTSAEARQRWRHAAAEERGIRDSVRATIDQHLPGSKSLDKDYIFINFVMTHLPHGLIGLLLAVVFLAAMSSTASELNALASTSAVDIYKRIMRPNESDAHYVKASRVLTVIWALLAMVYASLASQAENLIQFVNIIGSLFYGTLLGIFLVAFFLRRIGATAVFIGGIAGELVTLYLYFFQREAVAFLLYNLLSCAVVVVVATLAQLALPKKEEPGGVPGS